VVGTFRTSWAFVSQADYATYKEAVETYEKALMLGEKIAEAEAMGVTGLTEEKTVFANTSSTTLSKSPQLLLHWKPKSSHTTRTQSLQTVL
jgi:hypothetical protein